MAATAADQMLKQPIANNASVWILNTILIVSGSAALLSTWATGIAMTKTTTVLANTMAAIAV